MRRINLCLNKQLLTICQKSMQLESLNINVKQFLPAHLQEHCRVSHFEKGIMTLTVDESVWANELRYFLSEIRDKLRKDAGLYQLVSIKTTIASNHQLAKDFPMEKAPPVITREGKERLKTTRANCQFSPLKNILDKLVDA